MSVIIISLVILSILVVIHEFGHFLIAKKNGIYVEEFGFGIPPRLFGIRIGETLYSINILPFGGFVKVLGEEQNELLTSNISKKMIKRAFVNKPAHVRLATILAGVIMNLILGIGLYYILLSSNNFTSEPIPLIREFKFRFGTQKERVLIGHVLNNSPAEKAGIKFGDMVFEIKKEGEPHWNTVSSSKMLSQFIQDSKNTELLIKTVNIRTDEKKEIRVIPKYIDDFKQVAIGVQLVPATIISYQNPLNKAFSGILHSYNIISYNINTLSALAASSIKKQDVRPLSESIAGPIGIFSIISEIVASSGKKIIINLLNLIALLSLSLAVLNILPIPALDGGRAVFILYEMITRKKINPVIERRLNITGFTVLILLLLAITLKDVLKLSAP